MVRLALLLRLTLIAGFFAPFGQVVASELSVTYRQGGEDRVILGTQLAEGVYQYNADGSKPVTLSTLEWAPYIGASLCKQGWVMQATVALLASRGYRIKVHFRPWLRAVMEAESGASDILFPEYFIEPEAPSDIYPGTFRAEHLALSDPIPGGPIALVKRKTDHFEFTGAMSALVGTRVGVVRGYQNTPEFDALLDKKLVHSLEVKDDLQNAQILHGKRVDFIVGDPSVIFFSVQTSRLDNSYKEEMLSQMEMVEPPLQYNALYYAISHRSKIKEHLLEDLNAAINEFTQSGEMVDIIQRTNAACGFRMETLPVPNAAN